MLSRLSLPVLLLAVLSNITGTQAAVVSEKEALTTAYAWLSMSPEAMHETHGDLAGTVTPVLDASGEAEVYAVDLKPAGYVIVAADDAVEPIIAFSTTDKFSAVAGDPLFEMLKSDLPGRLARGRAGVAEKQAPRKWKMLRAISSKPLVLKQQATIYTAGDGSVSSVSDVRVAPLTKSQWNQLTSNGLPVFNYYTPPHSAGSLNNYYTGCVATMLGQIMRFHQWPQTGVGTGSYQVTVNGNSEQKSLRGGDGAGGSYVWANMPLTAYDNMPASQQQAISALLYDAGVASNMDYEPSGSGADIRASVLTNVFHYANAAFSGGSLSNLDVAIRANLDAGLPVGLGISGNGEGHAVVADGYGYNGSTIYHHLNMGWSGDANAWYNLPTVAAGGYDFTVVNGVLFNVEPALKGEVVSGRVADGSGKAVAGVVVTLTSGTLVMTATTSAQGVFGVKGVPSNSTWKITPAAESMMFSPAALSVTTGRSGANGGIGDKTDLNFSSTVLTGAVTVQINPEAAAAGAEWRVDSGAWQVSGATLPGVKVGTRTLGFKAGTDWAAPASEQITVVTNETASESVTYSPVYSLTAAADNSANGQVTADPAPGALGSYALNTSVTLTAAANAGYYFAGWLENGALVSTDVSYTSVVKGARQLVANFAPDSLTGSNSQVYVTSNKAGAIVDVLLRMNDAGGTLSVLSVTQPANGSVTINQDGTLTFTPGTGFHGSAAFSVTVGDGKGGTITRTVTISNWFTASAGTYAGLSLADEVANESSGYLKATVSASGALTGKLTYAGVAFTLTGAFDGNANYSKVITRKGSSSLNVALHLDAAADITGTVGDGVTNSHLFASKVIYSAKNKAPQAGRYAALYSGNTTVPGNGYSTISISSVGAAAVTGRLADGTPFSAGGYVNADGSVPYYAGVYKSGTGAGSIFGTMDFDPNGTPQCSGSYAWFRPSSNEAYYPSGFALSGTLTGAMLPAAANGAKAQVLQSGGISAELSGGGLAGPIDETGTLLGDGKIVWSSAGSGDFVLTVGALGQIKGTFVDPVSGKKRVVLGVWLSTEGVGGGFFVGDSSAGAVTLGL